MVKNELLVVCGVLIGLIGLGGVAIPANATPNGIGVDPDGDSNPATDTRAFARTGPEAEKNLNPPYQTITFEAPPGGHGDIIRGQYGKNFGVKFSRGLNREICAGQRYFQYDSKCTYLAAPSGKFAALYKDDYQRPLRIRFDRPICAAALAAYPTGGKEGERFQVTMQPFANDETKMKAAIIKFTWTHNTFRWRNMVGAFFSGKKASRVDVSVKSLDKPGKKVALLIDDVSFIEDGCDSHLEEIKNEASDAT